MAGIPVQALIASRRPAYRLAAVLLLTLSGGISEATGQTRVFRVEVRNTSLDAALRAFASNTETAVAYDPNLTRGLRVTCAVQTPDIEAYLSCLLRGTGLEFFRRASGTYVIGTAVALPAVLGMLEGNVGDSADEGPLTSAHVVVGGANRGTISGSAGRFRVAGLLPGRYRVSVSHVGYGTWSDSIDVVAGSTTRIRPLLQRRVHSVDPIVVEQSGTAMNPLEREIAVTSAPLRNAMGPAGSFADMTARLRIQGSDAGDLQMRLDGKPVYLPRDLIGFFGPFSRSAINGVRVGTAGYGVSEGSLLGGILDFSQKVDTERQVRFSADPYQVEGSVGGARTWESTARTAGSLSIRSSIWGQTRPTELETTFRSWSRLDPFVLFAPARDYESMTEESARRLFDLREATPSIGFTDLHAVLQHRPARGGSWRGNLFHAERSLSGDRRLGFLDLTAEQDSAPLLSSVASHDWTTTTGSLEWSGLLGSRTFIDVSGRMSRYRYRHVYTLAEARDEADVPAQGAGFRALDLGDSVDGNDLDEFELAGRIDHSLNRHLLSAGLEATRSSSEFALRLASTTGSDEVEVTVGDEGFGLALDTISVSLIRHAQLVNHSKTARFAAWISDRFETERLAVELGGRFTFRPDRRTLYAEPRGRAAWRAGADVVVALSAGLYRQYLNQFDHSTLNAGEFTPSTRIWLPLDESQRPPRALHTALDWDWRASEGWEFSGSFYWKRIDGGLAINYALESDQVDDGQSVPQDVLLTRRDARHRGLRLAATHTSASSRLSVRYDREWARLTSRTLFDGATVPAPWEIPHRLLGTFEITQGPVSLSLASTLEAGMTWAFRQAYYDYFGHLGSGRSYLGWDLAKPGDHDLPIRWTVDAGAGYAASVGGTRAALRVEMRNLLDRQNELDRRLLWDGTSLIPDARYLPGRTVAAGISVML